MFLLGLEVFSVIRTHMQTSKCESFTIKVSLSAVSSVMVKKELRLSGRIYTYPHLD